MPRLNSKAWMAIYETLVEEIAGGQDEVARVAEGVFTALAALGALKKGAL